MIRQIRRAVSTARPPAAELSCSFAGSRNRTLIFAIVIVFAPLLGLLALSCGVQGPARPPRIERPQQITDLSISQRGRSFVLRFTIPVLATDGERLTKPLEIEIFRTITPPGAPAAVPQPSSEPLAAFGPDQIHRLSNGNTFAYVSMLAPQDYLSTLRETYSFAVRGLTWSRRGRPLEGALSKVAVATLLSVSESVEGLRARCTQKAIELDWAPVEKSFSGGPLEGFAGYRVYRSESGKPDSFVMLAETLSPAYSDATFLFEHTYYYRVQALFKHGTSEATSDDSPAVEITPHDVFPPESPRDLTGVFTEGSVELVWTPSDDADLAGYNVYRRESGGAEIRINKDLVRTPVFRDSTVHVENTYFYRVTAIDLVGNESARSVEAAVKTR